MAWISLIRRTASQCSGRLYCWGLTVLAMVCATGGWFVSHYWESLQPQAPVIYEFQQVSGWELNVTAVAPTSGLGCTRMIQHLMVQGTRIQGTNRYEDGALFQTLDYTLNGPGLAPFAKTWTKPLIIPRSTPPGVWDYWLRSYQHCPPLGIIAKSSSVGPYRVVVPDERGKPVISQQ